MKICLGATVEKSNIVEAVEVRTKRKSFRYLLSTSWILDMLCISINESSKYMLAQKRENSFLNVWSHVLMMFSVEHQVDEM